MKQAFLPGFPDGAEQIGASLSRLKHDGTVTYFLGSDNYFSHKEGDRSGERVAVTSLIANRHVRAVDLADASLSLAGQQARHYRHHHHRPCRFCGVPDRQAQGVSQRLRTWRLIASNVNRSSNQHLGLRTVRANT